MKNNVEIVVNVQVTIRGRVGMSKEYTQGVMNVLQAQALKKTSKYLEKKAAFENITINELDGGGHVTVTFPDPQVEERRG